jgi:hypothetical protein
MLEGMKEIAAALEVLWGHSVSTWRVWRYAAAKVDPMPVYRGPNAVSADPAELLRWARRQPRRRTQAGAPLRKPSQTS